MRLRPFATPDLGAVLTLFRDSVSVLGRAAYSSSEIKAWIDIDEQSWLERLQAQNVLLACDEAYDDHAILGFIAWDDLGYIDFLYVSPRAARRGVATTLCDVAEARLRESGCAVFKTDASEIARPFFEKRGYTITKTNAVPRKGQVLRNYSMTKRDAAAGAPE